jgi:hypothetical protein
MKFDIRYTVTPVTMEGGRRVAIGDTVGKSLKIEADSQQLAVAALRRQEADEVTITAISSSE